MLHNYRNPESLPLSRLADTWQILSTQPDRIEALRALIGPAPPGFEKPSYGTPQYLLVPSAAVVARNRLCLKRAGRF